MQLFNLAEDKAEKKNLVSKHPECVQELLKILQKEINNGRCTPGKKIPNDREILPSQRSRNQVSPRTNQGKL